MSVQVENLENNMAKLTIEISAEELDKAIEFVYRRQKSQISIPGFRKGKVPRAMIEKMYGPEVFYEDAANKLIRDTYSSAMDESGEDIVSRPTIDIVQIEKGMPFIYTAEVAIRPEVTLGSYKGISVTKVDTSVTEEDVDKALENERKNNARTISITDRPIQEGDTAVIDFEGFVDGVPFDGGKGENHPLVIGSHSFIDTFEDQLVGHAAGDDVDVNVTFPEQYQAEELAGKPALFKVTIHEVQAEELPELDDEFAQDVSEYDTLDEYREYLKEQLAEEKKEEARKTQENEAIQAVVDQSEMDIPEAMIETQCDTMIEEFAGRIMQSGLTMEQYMQMSGMTTDKLRDQVRPEAVSRIQNSLVLEQIVEEEDIEVSYEDIEEEIDRLAADRFMDAERFREYIDDEARESIRRDLEIAKAIDLIMDNAEECEKTA